MPNWKPGDRAIAGIGSENRLCEVLEIVRPGQLPDPPARLQIADYWQRPGPAQARDEIVGAAQPKTRGGHCVIERNGKQVI